MADDKDKSIQRSSEKATDDETAIPQFVSQLLSLEQQVGANVIAALRHEGTVAVLSAVLPGDGGERIASVPLDAELWMKVQALLNDAGEEQSRDVPCIGFHCRLREKQEEEERKRGQAPPDNL